MARGPKPGTRPSGRQKGAPNRQTARLHERIIGVLGRMQRSDEWVEAGLDGSLMYPPEEEWDPVVQLAVFAASPNVPQKLRVDASKEVARYIHSPRKAVDHTHAGPDGGPIQVASTVKFYLPEVEVPEEENGGEDAE